MRRAFLCFVIGIAALITGVFWSVPAQAAGSAPGLTRGVEILYERDRLKKGAAPGEAIAFSHEDFLKLCGEKRLEGIYLRRAPEKAAGTLFLGAVPTEEDTLIPAELLERLRFVPRDASVREAVFTFRLAGEDRDRTACLCFGKGSDTGPVSESLTLTTYKNVACFGKVAPLSPGETVRVVKAPKRGALRLSADGASFCYTPGRNLTGSDRFSYQIEDAFGNRSKTATVTVRAVRSKEDLYFADCGGSSLHNAAIAACEAGLFTYEINADGLPVFHPEQPVTEEEKKRLAAYLSAADESLSVFRPSESVTREGALTLLQGAGLLAAQPQRSRKIAAFLSLAS